ncbi:hypothetical protein CR513_39808, partial [Mucuna pruriens]
MTTKTKIEVHAGTLSMEFGDTFVKFNIFEALKHPIEDHSIFSIDAIDELVEDYFQIGTGGVPTSRGRVQLRAIESTVKQIRPIDSINYVSPQSNTELKPLLEHLKYAYLGNHQQLLVIIANNLNGEQEEKLLEVLRKHKKAIGWTFADLPGINPSICMHKILLEEDA